MKEYGKLCKVGGFDPNMRIEGQTGVTRGIGGIERPGRKRHRMRIRGTGLVRGRRRAMAQECQGRVGTSRPDTPLHLRLPPVLPCRGLARNPFGAIKLAKP